jgi:predicted amidophosphoribosyltransferase
MGKFKHHSAFETENHTQSYLFPNVCFHCRKSYKKPKSVGPRLCPECGKEMTQLSRKFSAPSKTSIEEWNVVEYLVSEGFRYHTIHLGDGHQAKYPRTTKEAAVFVQTFKK